MVRERDSELMIDGEMQADTALDADQLRENYKFSRLQEPANVLVFPNLTAANAAIIVAMIIVVRLMM